MSNLQTSPSTLEISGRLLESVDKFPEIFSEHYSRPDKRLTADDRILHIIISENTSEFWNLMAACWRHALVSAPEDGVAFPSFLYSATINLMQQRLTNTVPLNNRILNRIAAIAITSSYHFRETLLTVCEKLCNTVLQQPGSTP